MKNEDRALTERRIAAAVCPLEKSWIALPDGGRTGQPGLIVRVYRSGAKSYWYRYRIPGAGRSANGKWVRIGDAARVSLKAAREAAGAQAGEVAKGNDPAAARRNEKRRERARLETALDGYEASLAARNVVKRAEVLSLLRRELQKPLGNVDLADIDRATLVARINAVRDSGRPGAAKELRTRAGVFLGWCVDMGLIPANPLAGWRQPRRTRAERIAQRGRTLSDSELPGFWSAASAQEWPFGPYLKILLLIGQRRTETAHMAWRDLALDHAVTLWSDLPPQKNVWIVPPAITKSGRPHYIPLPRQAVAILRDLPRLNKCDLVFPGRLGRPMSGWSKRLRDVYASTEKDGLTHWTLHDLRRTMRTGLSKVQVEPAIAELLIDHAISDELSRIYDRGDYWPQRVEASQQWANYVFDKLRTIPIAGCSNTNVVNLARTRQ